MVDAAVEDLKAHQENDLQGRGRQPGREQGERDRPCPQQANQKQQHKPPHQEPEPHPKSADPVSQVVVVQDGVEVLVHRGVFPDGPAHGRQPAGRQIAVQAVAAHGQGIDLLPLDHVGHVGLQRPVRGQEEDPPRRQHQHVVELPAQRAMGHGDQVGQFPAEVVLVVSQRDRQHPVGCQAAFRLRKELLGVEAVDLRRGRIGHVDNDHAVPRGGLSQEQPPVRVANPDTPLRVGEVLRHVFGPDLDNQRIEFHVVHDRKVSVGAPVLEDLPGRARYAPGDQQHPPRVRALGHGQVDRLLHLHRLVGGEQRHAVLEEVVLPRRLRHDQPPVGAVAPVLDRLTGVLDTGGDGVQIAGEH